LDEDRLARADLALLLPYAEAEPSLEHEPCLVVGAVNVQAGDRPSGMRSRIGPVGDDERLADEHAGSLRRGYARRRFCSRLGPVIPWLIMAVVAVPILVLAFAATRRRAASADGPAETPTERAEVEREFEAAEAYQAKWREEEHREHPPESLY